MNNFFGNIVLAQTNTVCDPNAATLCNPTHTLSIASFLSNLMVAAGVLVGIFTIAMVVYSGFRMIISQGNEEDVSQAKTSLQWSVSGLVLIISAFAIISAI